MIVKKIAYIILLIISVFFYILFIDKLSLYLMVFLLILPAVLGAILITGKLCIKCTITPENDFAVKKENCKFVIRITNKSFFPFPSGVIKLEYMNRSSTGKDNMYISVPIHPHTSQTLTFSLSSDYCGILSVRLRSVRIYDYIRLFSCRAKSDSEAEVCIIPDIDPEAVLPEFKNIDIEDSEILSKHKSGDDPAEIFELKEYVPGDRMNRIHWNLSSRQEQLITKHYSQAVSSPTVVIADMETDPMRTDLAAADTALELFYGISYILIENEISHEVYCTGTGESINVSDHDSLNECFRHVAALAGTAAGSADILPEIAKGKSKVYVISDRNSGEYQWQEFSSGAEINCIFADKEAVSADFSQCDNINIIKIPAGSGADCLACAMV
ncbi:MAG: DUF58 domain-containing protein [Porcipelethomonas sp.]